MTHPNRTKLATLKALAKAAGMTFHREKYTSKPEWVLDSGQGLKKYLMGYSVEKIDLEAFKLDIIRLNRANELAEGIEYNSAFARDYL